MKIIALNKKAFHDYDILEKLEVGIVLSGDEVKSIRAGHASLVGAYATIHQGELYLLNCRISPYSKAFGAAKDEEYATRRRKLLLHKKQLQKIIGQISLKGITLVPLKLYFNERNIAKIELGLAKHKKAEGKKQALRERDIRRETGRELRGK
jgi:SsrA-binding protein